jgi:hypothetical protein
VAAEPNLPSGPETEKKRRLTETDVDPAGDLTSTDSGETENPGTRRSSDNQPAESHENPSRSDDRGSGNRDTENEPKPGHEE